MGCEVRFLSVSWRLVAILSLFALHRKGIRVMFNMGHTRHILHGKEGRIKEEIMAKGNRGNKAYLMSVFRAKGSKTTAPGIPAWSPTAVLTWPSTVYLHRSDGMWGFMLCMAVVKWESMWVGDKGGGQA